jgi:hypothetical protein
MSKDAHLCSPLHNAQDDSAALSSAGMLCSHCPYISSGVSPLCLPFEYALSRAKRASLLMPSTTGQFESLHSMQTVAAPSMHLMLPKEANDLSKD